MSKQGDAAYAWFLKGYNCSQSVVAAFAPQLGLTEEMALRLSAGFGAGIGRMREVCGAFCGVVTVLSMVYADPADPKDKSRMYALVQQAAEQYRSRNGGGSIINTGSGWGLKGGDQAAAYCAVKGGIVNVTRAMAIDHGPKNIRVNSVNPGDTDTAMLRDEGRQTGAVTAGDGHMDAYLADCDSSRPLARIGQPEDIANAVLFLASDLASWITGAALVVDGGGIA